MFKLFICVIPIFCAVTAQGQRKAVDTAYITKMVATIDSLQSGQSSLHSYFVRRYSHDGTTVNFEYLLDTASWNVFEAIYAVQTIYSRGDTSSRRTSFYLDKNKYVGVKVEEAKNSYTSHSTFFYLETIGDELVVSNADQLAGSSLKTERELKDQAKELWLWFTSLKESLQKRNAPNRVSKGDFTPCSSQNRT